MASPAGSAATGAGKTSKRSGSGLVKAVALGFVALVIVTGVIVGLFGPTIASRFVGGAIEKTINPTIAGSVRVSGVSLSWNGPQKIGAIEILDPSGTPIASLEGELGAALLALAQGDLDLGEVSVVRTDSDPLTTEDVRRLARAFASTSPPSGEPARVPDGLAGDFTLALGDVALEGGLFRDVEAELTLQPGVTPAFVLLANDAEGEDAVTVLAEAPGLIGSDGTIALIGSAMTIDGSTTLSGATASALLGDAGVTAASEDEQALTLTFALEERDGLLVPRSDAPPARLNGRLPARMLDALTESMDKAGVTLALTRSPLFIAEAGDLRIPLPDLTTGQLDLDAMRTSWTIAMDEIDGRMPALPDAADGTASDVQLPDLTATLTYPSSGRTLRLEGSTSITVDGASAGRIAFGVDVTEVLTREGAINPAGATEVILQLTTSDTQTDHIERLYPPAARLIEIKPGRTLTLDDVLGSSFNSTINARYARARHHMSGAPSAQVNGALIGSKGELATNVRFENGEKLLVRAPDGFTVLLREVPELIQELLPDGSPLTLTQASNLRLSLLSAEVPIAPDWRSVDLDASTGLFVVEADVLAVTPPDSDELIALTELRAEAFAGAQDMTIEFETFVLSQGGRSRSFGEGTVVSFRTDAFTPTGTMQFEQLPVRLVSLFSPMIEQTVGAALGNRLTGSISTRDVGGFDIDIAGRNGSISGATAIDAGTLTIPEEQSIVLETSYAGGALAGLLSDATSGRLTLDERSSGRIELRSLDVGLSADRAENPFAGMSAEIDLSITDLAGSLDGRPLRDGDLSVALTLDPSGDASLRTDLSALIDDERLSLSGPIGVRAWHDGSGAIDFRAMRLDADVSGSIPPTLVALVPDPDIRSALARVVDDQPTQVRISNAEHPGTLSIAVLPNGSDLALHLLAGNDAEGLLMNGTLEGTITPELIEPFASRALEGTIYSDVRVAAPTKARVTAPAYRFNADAGVHIASPNGARFEIDFEDPLVLAGVPSPVTDAVLDLGLRDLDVVYELLTRAMDGPSSLTLRADAYRPDAPETVDAAGFEIEALMGNDRPRAAISATGSPAALDALLETEGRIAEALGPRYQIQLGSDADGYSVELLSDLLQVSAELNGDADQGFVLAPDARIAWLVAPTLATDALLGEAPAGLRVRDAIRLEGTVNALRTGPLDRPFAPDRFGADLRVTTSDVTLIDDAGNADPLGAFTGTLASREAGTLAFDLRARRNDLPEAPPSVALRGVLVDLADSNGVATMDNARPAWLELSGELPSPLLDRVAATGSTIQALVGPRSRLDGRLQPSETDPETVTMTFGFEGESGNGRLQHVTLGPDRVVVIPEGGASYSLSEVTTQTSRDVLGIVLPLLSEFEKTAEDQPATVTTSGLEIPIDGDLNKLNGALRIDLGTMRFSTSAVFGRILDLTGNNAAGSVGQRLEPFDLRFEKGIIKYDRVIIPVGEFNLEMTGKVNLKSRRVNTLVFVPFYALSDDLAAAAGRIPGVARLTRIPIRVRGPFGEPETEVDFEALLERLPGALLESPGSLLDDLIDPKR